MRPVASYVVEAGFGPNSARNWHTAYLTSRSIAAYKPGFQIKTPSFVTVFLSRKKNSEKKVFLERALLRSLWSPFVSSYGVGFLRDKLYCMMADLNHSTSPVPQRTSAIRTPSKRGSPPVIYKTRPRLYRPLREQRDSNEEKEEEGYNADDSTFSVALTTRKSSFLGETDNEKDKEREREKEWEKRLTLS